MDNLFEWDPGKAERNLKKHGVSFDEAETVFSDPLSLTVSDPLHSLDESRFVITGLSDSYRQLVVIHADLGDKIPIISARLATASEKRKYEREAEK